MVINQLRYYYISFLRVRIFIIFSRQDESSQVKAFSLSLSEITNKCTLLNLLLYQLTQSENAMKYVVVTALNCQLPDN